jgi:hypothetical protein
MDRLGRPSGLEESRRMTGRPSGKKKKFQWELRFCQEVLDELHKQKHYNWVMPFYYPEWTVWGDHRDWKNRGG